MTMLSRITRLEKKFAQLTEMKGGSVIWRDISTDDRLLDKNEFVMTDVEVSQAEKENLELSARGYKFWYEVNPYEPKLKPGSSTIPRKTSASVQEKE